jgi:nuclear pore complex protein Nup62
MHTYVFRYIYRVRNRMSAARDVIQGLGLTKYIPSSKKIYVAIFSLLEKFIISTDLIHVFVCVFVFLCVCVCMFVCVCFFVFVFVFLCAWVRVSVCLRVYVCVYVFICVCACGFVRNCVCFTMPSVVKRGVSMLLINQTLFFKARHLHCVLNIPVNTKINVIKFICNFVVINHQ